jgi:hypothetical protein
MLILKDKYCLKSGIVAFSHVYKKCGKFSKKWMLGCPEWAAGVGRIYYQDATKVRYLLRGFQPVFLELQPGA